MNGRDLKEKLQRLDLINRDLIIYDKSITEFGENYLFLIKLEQKKKLVLYGEIPEFDKFVGKVYSNLDKEIKICEINHENVLIIREILPYTAPKSIKKVKTTIGVGDRLGIASPGHCRVFSKYNATPVLAQQSIRELNLTGRTYGNVLDDASWGALQEGYTSGFGADGDHLKTCEEIEMAINSGFNMITLDCSEYIDNSIDKMSESEINTIYLDIEHNIRKEIEDKYLTTVSLGGLILDIEIIELKKIVLVYYGMFTFIEEIYTKYIKNQDILFEISIDETGTPTTPQAHYVIADYLISKEVEFQHLAPRFIGEFQKGIDYIGDTDTFKKDFLVHVEIAKYFNYKLSIHSGSDKFSVFPIIGEYTNQVFHLKTAGTNWLEALKVIAKKDYNFYRKIHEYALNSVEYAKKYYHIKGIEENIAKLEDVEDENLIKYLEIDDSRQILHITYGLILNEKDVNGNYVFKDKFFEILNKYEEEYYNNLENHIGKHLELLQVEKT